jgi:pyroglutamyl-peptidase
MSSILFTSFQTWLPHQPLNSSDALLEKLNDRWQVGCSRPPLSYRMLRQLPVDSDRAMERIETALGEMARQESSVQDTAPRLVVCCGMAENRQTLDLEWQAFQNGHWLQTPLNLPALAQGLQPVGLSWDAGRFVCNSVYYRVLNLLMLDYPTTVGLFVHVPLLPPAPSPWAPEALSILAAFEMVLIRSCSSLKQPC